MDWKTWKSLLSETNEIYDKNKIISFNKDQVLEARDIMEEINLNRNKFILFDLETSGLVERFPNDKSKSRQQEQILQIGALAITIEKDGEDLKIIKDGTLDITVKLQDSIRARLDPDSKEYRAYLLHKVNTFLNDEAWKKKQEPIQIDTLNDAKNLPDDLRNKVRDFIKSQKTTSEIIDMTGYKEENASLNEHDTLKAFIDFINKFPNRILSGHNILDFDLRFLKQRIAQYPDIGQLEPIDGVLDTIEIPRKIIHPALAHLESHLKQNLDLIDNQLGEHEGEEVEKLQEDEEAKKSILDKAEAFIQAYPEEKKELAKYKFLYTVLYTKVMQTRQYLKLPSGRYTSSQGPLANVFKVDSKDWHNALADVTMLSEIYRSLYKLINFAIKYSQGTLKEEVLSEMEPYQRMVTQKHPAAKQRLTGQGSVKSIPYKIKISNKRGKSAPPIG